MEQIKKAWLGKKELYIVFWYYYIVGILILSILIPLIGVTAEQLKLQIFLYPPLYLFVIVYGIWIIVSLWRSAFNAKWKGWGYITRIIIIISALSYILYGTNNIPGIIR